MKYILVIGDGMADHPLDTLGGRTPLEASKKDAIDDLARHGILGSCNIALNQFAKTKVSVYFRSVSVLRSSLFEVAFCFSSITGSECQFTQVIISTEIVRIKLSCLGEDSFFASVVVSQGSSVQ